MRWQSRHRPTPGRSTRSTRTPGTSNPSAALVPPQAGADRVDRLAAAAAALVVAAVLLLFRSPDSAEDPVTPVTDPPTTGCRPNRDQPQPPRRHRHRRDVGGSPSIPGPAEPTSPAADRRAGHQAARNRGHAYAGHEVTHQRRAAATRAAADRRIRRETVASRLMRVTDQRCVTAVMERDAGEPVSEERVLIWPACTAATPGVAVTWALPGDLDDRRATGVGGMCRSAPQRRPGPAR